MILIPPLAGERGCLRWETGIGELGEDRFAFFF